MTINTHLHLAINHTLILPLAIHAMNFRNEPLLGQRREQHVIGEYRREVQHALAARRGQRVGRVIRGRPGVGAAGHASIGQFVEYALVRVG